MYAAVAFRCIFDRPVAAFIKDRQRNECCDYLASGHIRHRAVSPSVASLHDPAVGRAYSNVDVNREQNAQSTFGKSSI